MKQPLKTLKSICLNLRFCPNRLKGSFYSSLWQCLIMPQQSTCLRGWRYLETNILCKSLVQAEINYSIIEKVMPALITFATKLRPYFQCHPTMVVTTFSLKLCYRNLICYSEWWSRLWNLASLMLASSLELLSNHRHWLILLLNWHNHWKCWRWIRRNVKSRNLG